MKRVIINEVHPKTKGSPFPLCPFLPHVQANPRSVCLVRKRAASVWLALPAPLQDNHPMAALHTPTDPMPTSHAAVREEIKYWQKRFNEGGADSTEAGEVRKRLEALYALDRAAAQSKRAPRFPPGTRVRSSLHLLVQAFVWIGVALRTLVLRRRERS